MKKLLITLATAVALTGAYAGGENWQTDLPKAQAQAAKEKKMVLLDFTGSDWCGWCIKLNKEVFSQDAFTNEAPTHFILVELDCRNRRQRHLQAVCER